MKRTKDRINAIYSADIYWVLAPCQILWGKCYCGFQEWRGVPENVIICSRKNQPVSGYSSNIHARSSFRAFCTCCSLRLIRSSSKSSHDWLLLSCRAQLSCHLLLEALPDPVIQSLLSLRSVSWLCFIFFNHCSHYLKMTSVHLSSIHPSIYLFIYLPRIAWNLP